MPRLPKYVLPELNLGSESVGQRIARIRKQRGLTQQQLADKIGIERYLVSDYEQGRIRLFDQMVARFALALEVSADELLGLKSSELRPSKPSLRITRRLQRIQQLPETQQRALLKTIDMALESVPEEQQQ